MSGARLTVLVCMSALAACGGTPELECEDGSYKNAVRGPRVQAPDDLDQLNSLREMPIPAASPQAPQPDGDERCLEMPPTVIGR